ncbi:AraC family ligand binding domain-containing protein [Paenibacillus riograndensis]|uniref:AraC family ligand binding domain-containing protein n=1 Tax=Paenibacillus riograndensis TaxID=483937 RepID=UPI001E29326C|nr:AraC family ligand binding domain-containing protein [Paenibacillus riograndensis]
MVSGRGYLKTGQAVHPVEAGESFMIFPQMEVYYYPDPQDPWAYCWIEFPISRVTIGSLPYRCAGCSGICDY